MNESKNSPPPSEILVVFIGSEAVDIDIQTGFDRGTFCKLLHAFSKYVNDNPNARIMNHKVFLKFNLLGKEHKIIAKASGKNEAAMSLYRAFCDLLTDMVIENNMDNLMKGNPITSFGEKN